MKSKKVIASIAVGVVLVASVPGAVYGYSSYSYNKYYNAGLNDLKDDKFDSARSDFNSALKFKKGSKEAVSGQDS